MTLTIKTAVEPRILELEQGVELRVPAGIFTPEDHRYVATGDRLIEKCEAAWSTTSLDPIPLNFRLVGPPGVGKNAVVYELGKRSKKPVFIMLGHEDLTAEDMIATAALDRNGGVRYTASPLLAAMLHGGICFIDEIAKMRPRALAPLASVLDERRSISSALLGRDFEAEPGFRFCAAYNPTDIDAFDLPPWLRRRTVPEFNVAPPKVPALMKILNGEGPQGSAEFETLRNEIMGKAKELKLTLDPSTAITLVKYALRLSEYARSGRGNVGNVVDLAFKHVCGRE